MPEHPDPHQAWALIADRIEPLGTELGDLPSALDRRLSGAVVARWDQPRSDLSAMDGYACVGDLSPGAVLSEIAEIAAGDEVHAEVQGGTAAAIMTGGWLPQGADRVVPFEHCSSGAEAGLPEGKIRIDRPVAAGANIRRQGEVYTAGTRLIDDGTRLDAVHLGVAASEGRTDLEVARQPRVGLLVTGNEVLPSLPAAGLPKGALLDSHTPMLSALCRNAGVDPVALGVVDDNAAELKSRLASTDADLIVTTGGVSVGRHDHVPDVVKELGFDVLVHGVAMQPGKPVLVGVRAGDQSSVQWIVGLPGNPAAVFVGFHIFVAPLLRGLGGGGLTGPTRRRVRSATPLIPHPSRTRYLPASFVDASASTVVVRLPVGSHDLPSWAAADVLVELAPGSEAPTALMAILV